MVFDELRNIGEFLSEYIKVFFDTLGNPTIIYHPFENGSGQRLNPRLFLFLFISIFIGSTFNTLIPGRIVGLNSEKIIVTVVIVGAFWIFYSVYIYLVYRLLGGKDTFIQIMALSLQLLSVIYVVSSFVALGWKALITTVPKLGVHVASLGFGMDLLVRFPISIYYIVQFVLLALYFPWAFKNEYKWYMLVIMGILLITVPLTSITLYVPFEIITGPQTGFILISSSPSNASVYLDERYQGTTPQHLKNIVSGSHTITLKLSAYQDWSEIIYVRTDKTAYVSADLIPINNSTTGWQESDMGFTFVEQQHLVIGPGRNDGFNRVYSGDDSCCTGSIYEFSFINNQWEKINIVGDNSGLNTIYGLEMGDVRNDGVNRVYASGNNIAEYYYASDSWLGGVVGPYNIQRQNNLVLGDARNDGYVRMYMVEWDGINEISYNYGDWDVMEIDTGGQYVEKLLVTDGRNDGIFRLYAAVDGHVYEYSMSGNTWQMEDCGAIGKPYYLYYDMCAGDGRNDGKNRIYLASGGLYELTYDGENWDIVIANSDHIDTVAVGDGRNDGVNRLYTGSSTGIGEYTYGSGKTFSIFSGFGVNGIAVGDGRNDGINRVYVTGDDKHVYEYSFD